MADPAALDPGFLLHVLDEWKRDQRVPVLTATSLEHALDGTVSRPECELILARLCDDALLVQAWSKHRHEPVPGTYTALTTAGRQLVDRYRAEHGAQSKASPPHT